MSFNADMSEYEVMKRYRVANEMAITTSSRVVFKSLQDIPDLIKQIKQLQETISYLEEQASKSNPANFGD